MTKKKTAVTEDATKNIDLLGVDDIKLEIDVDNFAIDDFEVLDGSMPGVKFRDMLDTLDRVVVGGIRGKGIKAEAMPAICNTILEAWQANVNATDATEKN